MNETGTAIDWQLNIATQRILSLIRGGDAKAIQGAAYLLLTGLPPRELIDQLLHALRAAANAGNLQAGFFLAVIFARSEYAPDTFEEAEHWLGVCLEHGVTEASFVAGMANLIVGAESRWPWAEQQLQVAANNGHMHAQYVRDLLHRLQAMKAADAAASYSEIGRLKRAVNRLKNALQQERIKKEAATAERDSVTAQLRHVAAEHAVTTKALEDARTGVLAQRQADLLQQLDDAKAEIERMDQEGRHVRSVLNDYQRHDGYMAKLLRSHGIPFNPTIGHSAKPHEGG